MIMSPRNILLIFLLLSQTAGFGQKQIAHGEQVWLAYLNQTRFSDKWGLWVDLHLRTKEEFFTNFSTGIARLGLTYYITDNTKVTAGYAFVNHFPSGSLNISQPEHRPWQQLQWHSNYQRLRLVQYIRLEERFRRKIKNNDELGDGHLFNWRVRYNFMATFPLSKNAFQPGTWSFVLNDELHINAGKEILNNYFDQNRFFAGFGYHLTARDNVQIGYLNFFQQLPAVGQFRNIHAARVFFFHNLDTRRKGK